MRLTFHAWKTSCATSERRSRYESRAAKVAAKKRRRLSDDRLRIVDESPNVGLRDRIGWPDRIPVCPSEHLEALLPVSPELDGRVDEHVEVRRVEPVNGGP